MNCVLEWVNYMPLLNSFCFSLLLRLVLSRGVVLFVQTSRETLQYRRPDATQTWCQILRLFHALSTKDDGTLLCQISYTWPITIKNTLFPLMDPDRRKDKNQPTIHSLEVAIDKTFYLNIFRHLIRIQYQTGWKRNRNDRKIVKIFRRDLKNENVFSKSFQHSSTWPKKERHYAESRKRYWRKKPTFENILVIKGNN